VIPISARSTRVRWVRTRSGQGAPAASVSAASSTTEQGGHPTSTQSLVCWSAELCGMAVQIGIEEDEAASTLPTRAYATGASDIRLPPKRFGRLVAQSAHMRAPAR